MTFSVGHFHDLAGGAPGRRFQAVQSPLCPPEVLAALVQDPVHDIAVLALLHPNLPAATIDELLTTGLAAAAAAAQGRPGGPAPIRRESWDRLADRLACVIQNPTVTAHQLDRVAAGLELWATGSRVDRAYALQGMAAVLTHPNCSRRWLEWGTVSPVELYRGCVAQNSSLPDDLARRLMRNPNPFTRQKAARNPAVQVGALAVLAEERDAAVLKTVLFRLPPGERQKQVTWMLADPEISHPLNYRARSLAAQWSTDPGQVSALCLDEAASVRRTAASNPVATDADQVAAALLEGRYVAGEYR